MTAPVLEDGVADPAPGAVDPHDPPVEGVPNRLYGRRRGHPLRARQERLLQLAAPRLSADPAGIADPGALFASRPDEVWVEVGFGGGEHAEALARVLRPGGEWRMASDHPVYQAWVEEVFAAQELFEPVLDVRERPADWPGTRYEAKAHREGRHPRYWIWRRR